MTISRFLGALAITTVFVAGCRDNRALGTERNSSGASMTPPFASPPPAPTAATIVRAPEATSEEDIASIPELREPIWATEKSREPDAPAKEPAVDSDREDCVTSPGGQERQEAIEPVPR